MIKRKRYSKEYKERLVLEILSNQSTQTQVSKREGISPATLKHWQEQLARGGFQSKAKDDAAIQQRIKQLESAIGELALENHILKKSHEVFKEYQRRERLSSATLHQSSE